MYKSSIKLIIAFFVGNILLANIFCYANVKVLSPTIGSMFFDVSDYKEYVSEKIPSGHNGIVPLALEDQWFLAVYSNDYDAFKALFPRMRGNVNCLSSEGVGALHVSITKESIRMFCYLLLHGADSNVRDDEGRTPLHYAVATEDFLFVRLLCLYEADLTIKDNHGMRAVDYAWQLGCKDIYYYLDEWLRLDQLDGESLVDLYY